MAGLAFIEPQLATLADEPPEGPEWIHEIKYDGYRTQLILEAGAARAYTRNGHDWTARYRTIVAAAAQLSCRSAIVDGEVTVLDSEGRPDFRALRRTVAGTPRGLVFFGFDLLHLDGRDLRPKPLLERRAALRDLVPEGGARIRYSDHHAGDGTVFFQAAEAMGLEGIVSKKASSRYRSGRSRSWLKVKGVAESEFDVAGAERSHGGPSHALLLSRDGDRRYVGSAFVTLDSEARDLFWREVEARATPKPPLPELRPRKAQWLRPGLVARVRHLKGEEPLRHATLVAVRIEGS